MKETGTTSLRFGHVTEYDPSRHMARVNFPDLGLTSYWLPGIVSNTLKNHDETHVDIGEHVACMMSGQGAEMGVVLGAFYDDKNKPVVKDTDIRAVTFEDGTKITYDRKNHQLTIDSPETVYVSASKTFITSPEVFINGDVLIDGDLSALSGKATSMSGTNSFNGTTSISGDITLSGNITLDGSVTCPGYCRCS